MPDNTGVSAYPLAWPAGVPRTSATKRADPRFSSASTTSLGRATVPVRLTDARSRLGNELDRLGARYPVLSTNLELRLDGQPRAGQPEPSDPGVAVYFQLRGKPTALPCDRYKTGNIAAIAAHIAATRAIERHGVATAAQMFAGFQAIRGPGPKPWREVLGLRDGAPVTRGWLADRRRELAAQHHPDAGGSDRAMAEINAAVDTALAEIGDAA